jgi:hypothetical protein
MMAAVPAVMVAVRHLAGQLAAPMVRCQTVGGDHDRAALATRRMSRRFECQD